MRREGGVRKAGGQAGQLGAGRVLRPEDQVDEIVDHYPEACGCGRRFASEQRRPAEHCNREQFNALMGTRYPEIVISDRWNGFERRDPHRRQMCWSHLQRDFRRHSEGLSEQKTFGEQGLELTRRVFTAWRAHQRTHHDRQQLKVEITPIQTELRRPLEDASPKTRRTRWHRRFANYPIKVWPALWTFTTIDGVEPTNNPAQRALRGPVIHQKLSLGTQSNTGERFAERALSAATTCRLQRAARSSPTSANSSPPTTAAIHSRPSREAPGD